LSEFWYIHLRCRRYTPVQLSARLFCLPQYSHKMDVVKEVRVFLQDLIRPIVVEAVKSSMTPSEEVKTKKYLTVKEVGEMYDLSVSTIYDRFKNGTLTRVKSGGRTLILHEELEKSLIAKKYANNRGCRRRSRI